MKFQNKNLYHRRQCEIIIRISYFYTNSDVTKYIRFTEKHIQSTKTFKPSFKKNKTNLVVNFFKLKYLPYSGQDMRNCL